MSELTLVSLFDGIGGFPLAFGRAGVRTVATVEIDRQAAGVVADRLPGIPHFPDVTEVTGADLLATGFDPARGIITAGFPCQDFSMAGRRMGLGGARSGLFFEIVRILDEVFQVTGVRCRWVVLENVPGLLSAVCSCPGNGACPGDVREQRDAEGRTVGTLTLPCDSAHTVRGGACGPGRCIEIHGGAMGAVLGELGQRRYGYAYRVLDAQHFGVPQRRRRVVIVANSGDWAAPAEVLLEPSRGGGNPGESDTPGPRLARVLARSIALSSRPEVVGTLPARETGGGFGWGADEAGVGLLVPEVAGTLTTTRGETTDDAMTGRMIITPPPPLSFDGAPVSNGKPGPIAPTLNTFGRVMAFDGAPFNEPAIVPGGPAPTLNTFGQGSVYDPGPAQGVDLFNGALVDDAANTLTVNAPYGPAVMDTPTEAAVRRLTPVECERLQGYPDGWTATSHGRPQADSHRYRELGNSIAVPCFEWLAWGIVEHEEAGRSDLVQG